MEARHRRNENANGANRNPYATVGHRRFRAAVLARDPRCVCMGECGRHEGICGRPATVADHFPRERIEIIQDGDDPDNPAYGRGVCVVCHNAKTARTRNVIVERVVAA